MKDYIYYCEYDDAKTGTRFTIEIYKAGSNPINKNESNRIELPYNTVSVKTIELSNHDTRIGLSAPCYATIDVDFSVLENTEYLEDFQEAIMFPTKTATTGFFLVGETIGTNWRIYEQHKLFGKNEFEEKRLIFVGQHTVGLEGEFNLGNSNVTVVAENITSFIMKRINTRRLFYSYATNSFLGIDGLLNNRNFMTTQVFYNHTESTNTGSRSSLMFSPIMEINSNGGDIRNTIAHNSNYTNPNRKFDLGNAIIILWNLNDLLRYIGIEISRCINIALRNYELPPENTAVSGLHNLFAFSFPLYRQKYDNSGEFGIRDTSPFIISKIKGREKDRPDYYNICSEDSKLFRDGRYQYLYDFITDLLFNFCVYGNYTHRGIALGAMKTNTSAFPLEIDLDNDGVEHTINFGISKYAKVNISNLEFYDEDKRDIQHDSTKSENANGMNIVTVFNNQPPNNKNGWMSIVARTKVFTKGGTPNMPNDLSNAYDWGYWGANQTNSALRFVYDILKQGDRQGEIFTLNLFYREKDPTTTERSVADKFIVVHNGMEKDEDGKPLNIDYPINSFDTGRGVYFYTNRQSRVSSSIKNIQDKGCFHNSIAKYMSEVFDNENYPFAELALKIPVKELNKMFYANTNGDAQYYPQFVNNFIEYLKADTAQCRIKTKHKVAGKQIIKEFWYPYDYQYNVDEGCFEIMFH